MWWAYSFILKQRKNSRSFILLSWLVRDDGLRHKPTSKGTLKLDGETCQLKGSRRWRLQAKTQDMLLTISQICKNECTAGILCSKELRALCYRISQYKTVHWFFTQLLRIDINGSCLFRVRQCTYKTNSVLFFDAEIIRFVCIYS